LDLAGHPDSFISTVQICITLIGLLTGIFSGDKIKNQLYIWLQQYSSLQHYSGILSTIIVVVCVAYVSLVLGELVPKRIGLSNPEAIAKMVTAPMRIINFFVFPFTWLLSVSSGILIRIFKIKRKDENVTEDEIKAIINEGTEQGTIEEAEQEIIERVFHLGDRNITSLMTHRTDIIWVDVTKTVKEVKEAISEVVHSVYPVCEGQVDNIQGTLSVKDLLLAKEESLVSEIMSAPMYVPDNNSAYQVLEKFKVSQIHHCFIVDEYGTLQGLITLNDILDAIVGDMPQPDEDKYEVVKRADGSFLIDAKMPFYDFLVHFDKDEWINEEEQLFDTLAGFVLSELKKIPSTGDSFEWRGFTFEIVDMDGNRIDKILVSGVAKQNNKEEKN
jgi:putative hemolysin